MASMALPPCACTSSQPASGIVTSDGIGILALSTAIINRIPIQPMLLMILVRVATICVSIPAGMDRSLLIHYGLLRGILVQRFGKAGEVYPAIADKSTHSVRYSQNL